MYENMYDNRREHDFGKYNIGITTCRCERYWMTLREAILYGGYNCIDGVESCDYCRDDERYNDTESEDIEFEEDV